MSTCSHLWAIGYDHIVRADQVREEIIRLGWGTRSYLYLANVAVERAELIQSTLAAASADTAR